MNSKMRSSVMGLILSLFSSPLPEAQKQPVAYLYNGVVLPPIEETLEKFAEEKAPYEFPYELFVYEQNKYGGVRLYVSSVPWVCNGEQVYIAAGNWATFIMMGFDSYYGTPWTASSSGYFSSLNLNAGDCFWTSHDILNEDGTVFMAATEPTPVYE